MNHRICFSYGDDEYLPVFTILGANLKQKNLFYCESTKTIKNGDYTIVSSRITEENLKPTYSTTNINYGSLVPQMCSAKKNKRLKDDETINMLITYNETGFLRGFLYIKGKEYPILNYKTYVSMQIENFAYDNIAILRLPNNFAEGNYF